MENVLDAHLGTSAPVLERTKELTATFSNNPIYSGGNKWSYITKGKFSLQDWFDRITIPATPLIIQIRDAQQAYLDCTDAVKRKVIKKEKRALKEGLPVIFASGIYDEGITSPTKYNCSSNIIVIDIDIDIDKKNNLHLIDNFEPLISTVKEELSDLLIGYHYSVSNQGLAFYMYCDTVKTKEEFLNTYHKYEALFKTKGVVTDELCKNINRSRYLSSDENAYLNNDFDTDKALGVFKLLNSNNDKRVSKNKPKSRIVSKKTSTILNSNTWSEQEKLEACIKVQSNTGVDITEGYDNWLNMAFALESEFGEGGRNYYHEISSYSHEYDPQLCDKQYTDGLKSNGTGITIGTLFKRFNDCGVKFADELIKNKRTPKKLDVTNVGQCPFTYESVSADGETTTIKFSTLGTLDWLEIQGFSLAKVNGVKEFVRVHNRIIEVVEPLDIKNTIISFCKSYDYLELTCVVEKLRSGYEGLFESLGYKEIPKRRKIASKTHFYFNNCVVIATADGFKKVQYKDYEGYAFKTELIDKDFKENHTEGHYQKFCEYVFEAENMDAIKTSLGYLLHEHNSGTDSFMIFVNDKEFDAVNHKANGGKGKGIFMSGPKNMLPSFLVDGKKFKADNQFQFASHKHGARLCMMPDIKPKFNLADLNVIITEGLTVEKKGQDAYFVESEDSPKFILDSNYVQKTDEGSIQRRMKNLYINNRYTNGKKPIHDFDKEIFRDWEDGDIQWDMFHTFMIKSTVKYIKEGIIDQVEDSSRDRLLISCTNDDFYNFALSDIHGNDIERYMDGVPFNLNKEIASYKDQSDNYNLKVSPKLFKTWIQALADFHMCGVKKVRTEGMHQWVFVSKI